MTFYCSILTHRKNLRKLDKTFEKRSGLSRCTKSDDASSEPIRKIEKLRGNEVRMSNFGLYRQRCAVFSVRIVKTNEI